MNNTPLAVRLHGAQTRATAVHRRAMALPYSPQFSINREWARFADRTRAAPNDEARLAVAQEAERAMLARCVLAPFPEHMAAWKADQDEADKARALGAAAAIAARVSQDVARCQAQGWCPPAPKSAGATIVAELARRGVTLSIADGKLRAAPAPLLTAADLETLRRHKAELVKALASTVEFA